MSAPPSSTSQDGARQPFDPDEIRKEIPFDSPVAPVYLDLDDIIQFQCRKGIACFNKCCHNIDITLTPYDILRLKNRMGITSEEFLEKYAVPFEMDAHGMPGLKLRTRGDTTACQFVTPEGCSVYEDRPTACRYYAMGSLYLRKTGSPTDEQAFFMVKEDHCLGHNEPRQITVRDYRQEQGVAAYDDMNRGWNQVVLKKRSCGPAIGRPSKRSFQLFFLASYNLDGFREFVASDSFAEVYALDADAMERLRSDEVALMQFGFRFLKQVLFGENTIPVRPDALEKRVEKARARGKVAVGNEVTGDDPRYDVPLDD